MIKNLLNLRITQAQRNIKSVGLLYGILIFCTFFIVLLKLLKSNSEENHQIATIVIIISILSIHFARNDKRFIFVVFHEKAPIFFATEYNLLILPFSIPLLFGALPMLFVVCHIAVSLIGFIENINLNYSLSRSYIFFRCIPSQNFEWRSGMRKSQFPILLLYFLCIILCFKYYGTFLLLGLITFMLATFYNEAEPKNILLLNHSNSKDFINSKLLSHLKIYLIFIAPIVLLYMLKYPKYCFFYIPILAIYILNFLVFILNKYKSYIPNKLNNSNNVIIGLLFLGMFFPFLFPLSIILVFIYYRKSIKNLNQYFNAENQ